MKFIFKKSQSIHGILKFLKHFFLLSFFGLFVSKYFAQTQPIFQKIDQYQGLSSSRITGIVKEKDGFVWISTQYGLNRYDGHSMKIYNKQNSNIVSNDISGLYLDRKNQLWLTTYGGGLNLYDKLNDTFISYKNDAKNPFSIISNRINTLIEDASGKLWIGTEKGLSLYDFETNKFYNYATIDNKTLNVISIFEDSNNRLWIGTFSSGILLFDTHSRKYKNVIKENELISGTVNAFAELNSDKILAGTSGAGLLSIDLKNFTVSNFFKENKLLSEKFNNIRSMKKDSKGNLWIGTDGFGLFELKHPNSKEPIINNYKYNSQLKSSLAGNAIYVITEDESSNIWIGTAWNGISILDNKSQTEMIFSDFVGKNPNPVLSIFQNSENIFLGLDGEGLNIFNKKNLSVDFLNESVVKAKYIQKIIQTKDGNFWLGTYGNGLLKFDYKTKKIIQFVNDISNNNSLSFNDVRDIVEDENQNLWIATWGGGLNYLNIKKNTFTRFNFLNNNLISILKEKDNIWIASYGGGLNVFNIKTKQIETFTFNENDSNSISNNNLFSILKDKRGYLWIGTSGDGINRMNLKTKQIERFDEYQNVKYRTITSILEDDGHNIWFGSKSGIVKFDYSSNTFNTFSSLSGDFHINSSFKDVDGFLYFGGINGVLKFNPESIINENLQPKVKIRNFKLFNKEVSISENGILKKNIELEKDITLNHSQNVITFEFSALKFPFSDNCEYAIKMENFEKDWRTIGKDRTATFTSLAPGDYTFMVKSKEIGANWNDEYTAIQIRILSPFWLTWWAYLLYFFLILFFLFLFRKNSISWARLKNTLELEKFAHEKDTELYNLKQQFFTNISHEIRTPVTLIISSINRLFDTNNLKDSKQIKAAHTIRRNSNLLLRLVNELLDVRKLESNEIVLNVSKNEFVSFVKEIYVSFSDIALDRTIKYNFKSDLNSIFLWFDRNQLEKVVFNLISNAFKFTNDQGEIEVIIEETSNEVILTVKDNGIGISSDEMKKIFNRFYQVKNVQSKNNRGFGLGLAIVKDVVELHKATIQVQSQYKKGSTFEVRILKGNEHFNSLENNLLDAENNTKTIDQLEKKISKKNKKKIRILIIEDNLEIQESLKEILEQESYEILQSFDGEDGLKKASTEIPDLIISDWMMPKMDGIELSKKIKKNGITSHIPIIILTAKTADEDKLEGFETGADEYIIKPYNEDFLLSRIKNLLSNRKLLKEKFVNNSLLNPKELTINSQDQIFLEKLYKSLEENIQSNNLNAQLIAEELHISHSAMYKKIKALTGLTFVEFYRDYRLSIAKQLIQEMGYSVSEACYKVGYSDRKYFSKLFKQKFKKNPSDFVSTKM
ncbi:hybrid sensor histidine kinase/response regulator transcription factor [Polaribacter sp.]|uniref:hybrid sensor histidine kinase/response regulator transcription factor n=1 Tax=Polaribacter sp. TaxID=1920175 RepID=UPI0040484E25